MAGLADGGVWPEGPGAPLTRLRGEAGGSGGPPVPHAVLGTLLFVIVELMLFAGLVSAYVIAQAANPGAWPPPGQPRLPVEATFVNTLVLLASGVLVWRGGRAFALAANRDLASERARADRLLLSGSFLGAFFVLFQGIEWVRLIREGLTLNYSTHGAFFYLIVGMHALHAIGALGALAWAYSRLRAGLLTEGAFWAVRIFWFFVVGLWPALYVLVYLT